MKAEVFHVCFRRDDIIHSASQSAVPFCVSSLASRQTNKKVIFVF